MLSQASSGMTTDAPVAGARRRWRARWLAVHRWIGFTAGLTLVLIGLTGSLLVYHLEIDEWLNPSLLLVTPQPGGAAQYRPFDELELAARRALPPGARLSFAQYPRHDGVAMRFNAQVPDGSTGGRSSSLAVYHIVVNPYTAQVTGQRLARAGGWAGAIPKTVVGFVFALHYALLLPRFGDPPFGDTVVAIIGMVLLGSLVSGVILWWPRPGQWKAALTIKYPAHIRRLHLDVHRAVGVYSLLVLLAVFISGVYLNLRAPFHTVVRLFSPAVDRYEVRSAVVPGAETITLGEALRAVQESFPDGRLEWIYMPRMVGGTYTVCQRAVPDISLVLSRRCIVVDQYSGTILHVQSPDRATAGEHFIQWQWPIHSGQIFGLAGRWMVLLSGLACPLLFGTGWYLWQRKRAGRGSA